MPTYTDPQIVDYYKLRKDIQPEVHDHFSSKAFQALRAMKAPMDISDDMIQTGWMRFLERIDTIKLDGPNALRNYFITICVNNYKAYSKKKARMREHLADLQQDVGKRRRGRSALTLEEQWQNDKEEWLVHLERELATIDLPCQQIFRLRYWENLKHKDIDLRRGANVKGNTPSSRNQLYRCIRKMRALMQKFFDDSQF